MSISTAEQHDMKNYLLYFFLNLLLATFVCHPLILTQKKDKRSSLCSLYHSLFYTHTTQILLFSKNRNYGWGTVPWILIQESFNSFHSLIAIGKISHLLDRTFPAPLCSPWEGRINYKIFKMPVYHRLYINNHLVMNSSRKEYKWRMLLREDDANCIY